MEIHNKSLYYHKKQNLDDLTLNIDTKDIIDMLNYNMNTSKMSNF